MVDRLSSLDVSFLYLEGPTTPMHVGELLTFTPGDGIRLDYDRLVDLIESRIALVPRYRQKVRPVPGNLAAPVWVDDPDFDITFHVRRSALPRPGSDEQLREFTARIMSRPLDRSRPLWEMYLVEGLDAGTAPGRVAIITKTHHALVDGVTAIDIGTVILDATPDAHDPPAELWVPEPEPHDAALVAQAVAELVRSPARDVDVVKAEVADVRTTVGRFAAAVGGVLTAARTAVRPAPHSPLNVDIGAQRRYGVARTSLEDYRTVRAARGGSVNDVVLATVAGALRSWLLFRGEAVHPGTSVRAMVPVSVRDDPGRTGAVAMGGGRVSSYVVDLPVGEPNPLVRLSQVTYAMRAHAESGQSIGADTIVALGGFAPPTLHALGARAASGLTRRMFNLVVTNVPGPQFPLYAAGARLDSLFPIVPLARGQAVSIGLTSYDGGVYYGLNADRDAMPDVDVLGSLIEESLAELVDSARGAAPGPASRAPSATAVAEGDATPSASRRRAAGTAPRTPRTTSATGTRGGARGRPNARDGDGLATVVDAAAARAARARGTARTRRPDGPGES